MEVRGLQKDLYRNWGTKLSPEISHGQRIPTGLFTGIRKNEGTVSDFRKKLLNRRGERPGGKKILVAKENRQKTYGFGEKEKGTAVLGRVRISMKI